MLDSEIQVTLNLIREALDTPELSSPGSRLVAIGALVNRLKPLSEESRAQVSRVAEEIRSLTTDPTDPRLGHGSDEAPVPQNKAYLILSEEERAKGFVRPLRRSYKHVGAPLKYPLLDLTPEQHEQYDRYNYVKFEAYPESELPLTGKYWTQKELDLRGCNGVTTMGLALCETYARNPKFYGSTYCCNCGMHRPVSEFVWVEDSSIVGS